jgi:hypothetical protein
MPAPATFLILLAATLGVFLLLAMVAGRRAERRAQVALSTLQTLKWSELAQLILRVMAARGLRREAEQDMHPGVTPYDFLLSDGEQRRLLSCKHVGTLRLRAEEIEQLQGALAAKAAIGATIATIGVLPASSVALAQRAGIELLAGTQLWTALQDLLSPIQLAAVDRAWRRDHQRQIALAVVGALLTTVLALSALAPGGESAPTADQGSAEPAVPRNAVTKPPAAASQSGGPALDEPQQRAIAARMLREHPAVASVAWSSGTTVIIALRPDPPGFSDELVDDLCARLRSQPALRSARMQFDLPAEGGQPGAVRWRLCR